MFDDDIPFPFLFLFGGGGKKKRKLILGIKTVQAQKVISSLVSCCLSRHTQSIIKPAALAITQQIK
jgi:hypothetical protein